MPFVPMLTVSRFTKLISSFPIFFERAASPSPPPLPLDADEFAKNANEAGGAEEERD